MADIPGQRVREIRKALGDATYPLSQAKLAAMLTQVSGKRYDDSMVTKMESGVRAVSAQDARWLAALDPMKRGPAWVLGWSEGDPPVEVAPAPEPPGQGVHAYLADKEKAAKKGGQNGGTKAG